MRPYVMYTPCDKSSSEKTGDIITFAQFEEGDSLSETHNDAESSDESDLVKKIWMQWIMAMMILYVRRC